jgi:Protein of unknown function (DUF2934)
MSLNQDKIMNKHKKARREATTDQVGQHHEPTFEQIQVRAYEIYIQRGRTDGFDLDDWLQAEKDLKPFSPNHNRVIGQTIRSKHGNRN